MNTKKIKVALLGVGTVGTGVYKLIQLSCGCDGTDNWSRDGSKQDPCP